MVACGGKIGGMKQNSKAEEMDMPPARPLGVDLASTSAPARPLRCVDLKGQFTPYLPSTSWYSRPSLSFNGRRRMPRLEAYHATGFDSAARRATMLGAHINAAVNSDRARKANRSRWHWLPGSGRKRSCPSLWGCGGPDRRALRAATSSIGGRSNGN